MPSKDLLVRSVMARGNGAFIVHSELSDALPFYELQGCNSYLASIPGMPHIGLRRWLAEASVVHLPADYGHIPLSGDCRRVVTFHNFYTDAEHIVHASFKQRFFYRHILKHSLISATQSAHHIVVVSRFLADIVRRHELAARARVDVIYNGIDTDRFKPAEKLNDRPLRILFVGNPSRRKGFHLVTALAACLPENVEVAFTTGLRDEQVKAIHPAFVSLGRIPYAEMHYAYQQSDLLFFPTYREGFGLCVAEAMACGLPVVSTNCSAIPELLTHGMGGYLAPPGDFSSMFGYIRRLLTDDGLRREMGAWNRDRAQRYFNRARMVREYSELFYSLV